MTVFNGPSWDWNDPAVRSYPRLKIKLIVGYIVSLFVVSLFAYFVGEQSGSAIERILPVIIGYSAAYPFIISIVLGNIKGMGDALARDQVDQPE